MTHFQVTAVYWPEGWEPNSPSDVPNCVRRIQEQLSDARLTYEKALTTAKALNRQCMDGPGADWYVVVEVEDQPVEQTVSRDASGKETTREVHRFHVVRPDDSGRGDCSHCPAHAFPCAEDDAVDEEQTTTISRSDM